MIPIYTGQPPQHKPTPALTIEEDSDRGISIRVIDPTTGNILAYLGRLGGRTQESKVDFDAKEAIESGGFSTDWAEWSDDGKFLRFR